MTVHLKYFNRAYGTKIGAAEVFQFPGGEYDLKNVYESEWSGGTWVADVRGADPADLVAAGLLGNAKDWSHGFTLMLPYLPAARADRGRPCGAQVYANLVNALGADLVITIDPHSAMMPKEVKNLRVVDTWSLIESALHGQKIDTVIAPDKGAVERASKVADKLDVPLIVARKERDFETGKLLSYDIPKLDPTKQHLVVDDICDGGGTFILLAQAAGVPKSQLNLWVTHGIFSGAATNLRNYYERILTTDSHPGHNRVGCATTIVPVYPAMHEAMIRGGVA